MTTIMEQQPATQTNANCQNGNTVTDGNPQQDNCNSRIEVVVHSKSDKMLHKQLDAKDDTLQRKRTSLNIIPHKDSPEADVPTADFVKHKDFIVSKSLDSSICSNHSSLNEDDLGEHKCIKKLLQSSASSTDDLNATDKQHKRNSVASVDSCVTHSTGGSCSGSCHPSSNSSSSSATSSTSGDILEDYQDLENGNILEDLEAERKNCISNSSSCIDDYSLREKLQNYVNAKQESSNVGSSIGNSTDADDCSNIDAEEHCGQQQTEKNKPTEKGCCSASDADFENVILRESKDEFDSRHQRQQPLSLPLMCDGLLSPQEVPMGRRYAEVAQFKCNKR